MGVRLLHFVTFEGSVPLRRGVSEGLARPSR